MAHYVYNNVEIDSDMLLSNEQISKIYDYCMDRYGYNLRRIEIEAKKSHTEELSNGDTFTVRGFQSAEPVEHIRRITGYLVGTVDRFNDSKKAEERDRVKHT